MQIPLLFTLCCIVHWQNRNSIVRCTGEKPATRILPPVKSATIKILHQDQVPPGRDKKSKATSIIQFCNRCDRKHRYSILINKQRDIIHWYHGEPWYFITLASLGWNLLNEMTSMSRYNNTVRYIYSPNPWRHHVAPLSTSPVISSANPWRSRSQWKGAWVLPVTIVPWIAWVL